MNVEMGEREIEFTLVGRKEKVDVSPPFSSYFPSCLTSQLNKVYCEI